jgi:hypothetical protein
MLRTLALSLLLACTGAESDSASDIDTAPDEDDGYTGFQCDEEDLEIDPLGLKGSSTSSPVVGDEWIVWLRCDGVTLTGPMIIQFDPLDFATLDENVVTFIMAGDAEMRVQVGGYQASMDLTVTE